MIDGISSGVYDLWLCFSTQPEIVNTSRPEDTTAGQLTLTRRGSDS